MDFHVLGAKGDHHIMTTHRGEADETPLQLISAERMQYFLSLERAVMTYAAMIGKILPAPGRGDNVDGSG